MTKLPHNRVIAAAFEDIEPDADISRNTALRMPDCFSWSYKLRGDWYTCRTWEEVVEVYTDRDECGGEP